MKILYFIVSINLTAASTVATQLAACADTETGNDTANWLTSSVSSLDNGSTAKAKPVGQKAVEESLSRLTSKSGSKNIVVATHKGIKMMPFVPNRKLPSKHDLETTLIPQTARLAPDPNKPLAGGIALYQSPTKSDNNYSVPKSTIASLNKLASNKKTWSNLLAATKATYAAAKPSGAGFPFLRQAERQLTEQPSEIASQPLASEPVISAKPSANLDQQMMDQYSQMELEVKSAHLNANRQPNSQSAMLNGQVSNQGGMTATTAGPAPFPLSLLPQASLKQLVRGMASRPTTKGPSTYFGCWHNSGGLSSGSFQHYSPASGASGQSSQRVTGGFRVPAKATANRQVSRPSNRKLAMIRARVANSAITVARMYTPPRAMQVAAYAAYPVRQFGLY